MRPPQEAASSYLEEDLPPDFWDSEPLPPPPEAEAEASDSAQPANNPDHGSLSQDPRFAVLQSLFPGKVIDWQEESAPTDSAFDNTNSANEADFGTDEDKTSDNS